MRSNMCCKQHNQPKISCWFLYLFYYNEFIFVTEVICIAHLGNFGLFYVSLRQSKTYDVLLIYFRLI